MYDSDTSMFAASRGACRWPALACALLALAMLAAAPAHAEKARFSVRWTPLKMHFQVYPDGRITGSHTVDVAVSRTQKPSGVFQSCKKVYTLEVAQVAVKDAKEQDTTMARKELRPGLCNFKNVHLSVTPFTNDELTQVCQAPNHTLHKQAKVIFWDNYYPDRDKYYNQFDKTYGKANADDYFTFTALVDCGGPKGHPANPHPATGNTGNSRWHPPVAQHPVGHPVNAPGGVHINPPNVGQHIECPKQTAARVIEGINDHHQPYSFNGTPWSPGQAQALSAYRTRVTRLNNRVHLLCYYGDAQHHGAFPLDRLAPDGRSCQSDGKTGFYCH